VSDDAGIMHNGTCCSHFNGEDYEHRCCYDGNGGNSTVIPPFTCELDDSRWICEGRPSSSVYVPVMLASIGVFCVLLGCCIYHTCYQEWKLTRPSSRRGAYGSLQ
jgi:hypothetical protein